MNRVSVIIPTWNRAETLVTAVNSALHQTYPILEVLICDDGSTDDSQERIAAIQDNRIRWIDCGRNGRPAIPRNIGIKESKGDWIAFLDSDDEWFSQKTEKQMEALAKEANCLAVASNANIIRPDKKDVRAFHTLNETTFEFTDLIKTNKIICSSALVHRSVFETTGLFPEAKSFKAIEDYALWLKVATVTNWLYVNQSLLNYLDNPGQSVRSDDIGPWHQRKIILADLSTWMETQKKIPAFYRRFTKKELLLSLYKTSKTGASKWLNRIRYELNL